MFDTLAGSPSSPVILHVPHASRGIPESVRAHILLSDVDLALELDRMTDAYTDRIASAAAALATIPPWRFVNQTSRLVVDPERFPDEREPMTEVGMGAVYLRTSHGEPLRPDDPVHTGQLLADHFTPYARAMADTVDSRLAETGRAVIIDVHSYPATALPYENPTASRPPVCLGTDSAHTPPWLLDAARTAFAPVGDVALDTPFAGCYVPLRHYGAHPDVSAIMLELRRDTCHDHLDAIIAATTRLIDAATHHAPRGNTPHDSR